MSDSFRYEELHGEALRPFLHELGALRIAVFREYPYLYDGDLAYEAAYLESYLQSPQSLVVLLWQGSRLVGATTGLPMRESAPEFQAPFQTAGYALDEIFYFGESLILPECRGRGAGHEFFHRRERHARQVGPFRYTTFCSVDRPAQHPQRPDDYVPLDRFWLRMGYTRQPHLTCLIEWKEIGETSESPKALTYWLKEWA